MTSMIDYNMPITMAYMKHMKLQLLNSQQDEVKPEIFKVCFYVLLCSLVLVVVGARNLNWR